MRSAVFASTEWSGVLIGDRLLEVLDGGGLVISDVPEPLLPATVKAFTAEAIGLGWAVAVIDVGAGRKVVARAVSCILRGAPPEVDAIEGAAYHAPHEEPEGLLVLLTSPKVNDIAGSDIDVAIGGLAYPSTGSDRTNVVWLSRAVRLYRSTDSLAFSERAPHLPFSQLLTREERQTLTDVTVPSYTLLSEARNWTVYADVRQRVLRLVERDETRPGTGRATSLLVDPLVWPTADWDEEAGRTTLQAPARRNVQMLRAVCALQPSAVGLARIHWFSARLGDTGTTYWIDRYLPDAAIDQRSLLEPFLDGVLKTMHVRQRLVMVGRSVTETGEQSQFEAFRLDLARRHPDVRHEFLEMRRVDYTHYHERHLIRQDDHFVVQPPMVRWLIGSDVVGNYDEPAAAVRPDRYHEVVARGSSMRQL